MEFVSFGVECHDLRPSPPFSSIVVSLSDLLYASSLSYTCAPFLPRSSPRPLYLLSFLCFFWHPFSRTADVIITKHKKKTKKCYAVYDAWVFGFLSGSGLRLSVLTETACLPDQQLQQTDSNSSQQQRPLIFLLRSRDCLSYKKCYETNLYLSFFLFFFLYPSPSLPPAFPSPAFPYRLP